LNSSRFVSERFGIKNTLESWISRCFQIRGRNTTRGCCKVVRGIRIQQAIAAERKSPACEDMGQITGAEGAVGHDDPPKEQGRPAQYNANGLASPGH
jgi:hypothetical protein